MDEFIKQITLLTGQEPPFEPAAYLPSENWEIFNGGGLSYSQLNEFLLAFGHERISRGFYNYFFCKDKRKNLKFRSKIELDLETPFKIESFDGFKINTDNFRKFALLKYGNFKFAFKQLSKLRYEEIKRLLSEYQPLAQEKYDKYYERPRAIVNLEPIEKTDLYLLGYFMLNKVNKIRNKKNAGEQISTKDSKLLERHEKTVKIGETNFKKYLTYDYMDVYVATSMRDQEDYIGVHDFLQNVFAKKELEKLNLRYFDPTRAYTDDRVDKGLIEALMIKRAKCTLYCAQESDTFGKDSELAATLAQGKPVVAYVPEIKDLDEYKNKLLEFAEISEYSIECYLKRTLIHRHPSICCPSPATDDDCCDMESKNNGYESICKMSEEDLLTMLALEDQKKYEKRAEILNEIHPLSLQVNLQTGVSNGVLVVRNDKQCAKVIEGIMKKNLEFKIEPLNSISSDKSYGLRETITGSFFRVVTSNKLLTNTFWNFYLKN